MSLTSALNSAVSGLGATARRAETVSANIAGSDTEGYARRSLTVVSAAGMAGVRVVGTERHVDAVVLGELRLSSADSSGTSLLARQLLRLESAIGKAGSADSVVGAIDRLDRAVIAAAANPGTDAALAEVADAASSLSRRFARASAEIQTIRAESDSRIGADVAALSAGLAEVATLDRQIALLKSGGQDASSLLDQRQARITSLSAIVPLKEVTRKDGATMLTGLAGTVLLDRQPPEIAFDATAVIGADMTGPLSPLRLDGRVIVAPDGALAGGSLSTAFELRDRITVDLQAGLDNLALLVESRLRLADSSLSAGMPGLLTDHGRAAAPSRQAGLAARLELNPAADFEASGALWKIRSGLGATQPLPPGDGRQLLSLRDAMRDLPAAASRMSEMLVQRRVSAEDRAAAANARSATLAETAARNGVNLDAELQDLLGIERAFAANARVLQAVDTMLQTLLER